MISLGLTLKTFF